MGEKSRIGCKIEGTMMKPSLTSQDKDTGDCGRVRLLKIKDAVLCFPTCSACWMCCEMMPRLHGAMECAAITAQVLVLAHEPSEGGEQAGQVTLALASAKPVC